MSLDVSESGFSSHPFYPLIMKDYLFAFDRSGQLRFTLLVPPACDVEKLSSLYDTIESHMFKTDPVGDRYATINGKWLVLQSYQVATDDGYPMECIAVILNEVVIHNERDHTLRILYIDTAIYLPPNAIRYSLTGIQQSVFQMFPKRPTLDFYQKFLTFFPENLPVLQKMQDYIQDFNENYIMMQGCESQVWKRIKSIWIDIVETLLYVNPAFACCRRYIPYMNELQLAVESCLLDGVYDVVYKGLIEIHQTAEEDLALKYSAGEDLTLQDLGLPDVFVCDLDPVVKIMKEMTLARTPIDMLRLLQTMMKTLASVIDTHTQQTASERDEPLALTTDDLLSCLVFCVIKCRPQHILADLAYMQNFRFSNVNLSEMGFHLVTFHAAVSYIQSEITLGDDQPTTTLEDETIEEQIQNDPQLIHNDEEIEELCLSSHQLSLSQSLPQSLTHSQSTSQAQIQINMGLQTQPKINKLDDNLDHPNLQSSEEIDLNFPVDAHATQARPATPAHRRTIGSHLERPTTPEVSFRTPTRVGNFLKRSSFNSRIPSGELAVQLPLVDSALIHEDHFSLSQHAPVAWKTPTHALCSTGTHSEAM
eukprot:TRINITY_DN6314_c0_g3_i1.p1 TRINITY_DN6314_c0_g3~~TRINITY_DN6314_c0_g3_i1.p1  ORF type:complete len:592 (-),score=128.23 TRINITY_DN6314_c0_g3_i1:394-2169(-)